MVFRQSVFCDAVDAGVRILAVPAALAAGMIVALFLLIKEKVVRRHDSKERQ